MTIEIKSRVFNPAFLPVLKDSRHRYIVLYGGAGSGKSVFAAQRFVYRLLTLPLCNVLVVRAVAATNRDSTFALFRQVIGKWGLDGLFSCKESDMRIVCANGNSVIFKGLDDTEKLKSITFPKGELTDIWVEEASEIAEEDFNQLDVRLRGKGTHKQIVLTFNPVSVLHWLKGRFFDRQDPRAVALKSTYKDNKFLDEDYKQTLEGYKDTDPYYYSVYCLGEWGVLGQTIFDARKVSQRLQEVPEPVAQGEFVFSTWYNAQANEVVIDDASIRWVEGTGPIKIYQQPQKGAAYVIGGDTAGEGSDFSVAQVIDHITGAQVCAMRGQMDEDIFAAQVYCLGKYYNTALVSIEANFSSYPIRELERLRYPRQFVRQTEDSFTHKIRQSYGFQTNKNTRPVVIAGLVEIVREHCQWINDRDTLNEMLTFVRNENGRPEAQEGAHDDCVMALAIAYYSKMQQSAGEYTPRKWTRDMWQDYNKASPEDKAILRKRCGAPYTGGGYYE